MKLWFWRILHLAFGLIACCTFLLSQLRSSLDFSGSTHKIKKLPRHLALLVDSEDVLTHLSKLVLLLEQLAHLGLQHISLYDIKGTLKCTLVDALKKNPALQPYSHDSANNGPPNRVVTHEDPCLKFDTSNVKYDKMPSCGMKAQLMVELLSLKDGKQAIVEASRNICLKALESGVVSNLKEEDINSSLKETGGWGPDPDLLLLFSNSMCLQGFPPWRLRLTEIQHMGSIKDISDKTIFHALDEFSHKHHRYGK